eukprot:tig00000093_g3534.t1
MSSASTGKKRRRQPSNEDQDDAAAISERRLMADIGALAQQLAKRCDEDPAEETRALRGKLGEKLHALVSNSVVRNAGARSRHCDQSPTDLKCIVCRHTFLDPVTSFCGDSFCGSCFRSCVMKSGKCPACSEILPPEYAPQPNLKLAELSGKLHPAAVARRKRALALREEAAEHLRAGRLEEAVAGYTRSAEEEAGPAALCGRAAAHAAAGRHEEALKDAEEAVALDPWYAPGQLRKGEALLALGRAADAFPLLAACLAALPNDEAAHDAVVSAAVALGKGEAPVDFRALLASAPAPFGPAEEAPADAQKAPGAPPEAAAAGEGETAVREEDLECSLCYHLLYEPCAAKCGHVFCKECMERALDHSHACPFCRVDISEFVAYNRRAVCGALDRAVAHLFPEGYRVRREQSEAARAALAQEVPIFVCSLALPGLPCPLHVFEPRYRLMMRRAVESGWRRFGMVCYAQNGPAEYGTLLFIRSLRMLPDGRSLVDTVGERRFRMVSQGMKDGYLVARVEWVDDLPEEEPRREQEPPEGERAPPEQMTTAELLDEVRGFVAGWLQRLGRGARARLEQEAGPAPQEAALYSFWVLQLLPVDDSLRYAFLSSRSARDRLRQVAAMLRRLPQPAEPLQGGRISCTVS